MRSYYTRNMYEKTIYYTRYECEINNVNVT